MSKTTAPVGLETRTVLAPIEDIEIRESGKGDGSIHLVGHAAIFDRLSHDLGGFREKINRGAFAEVLDTNPDVHLVIGHNMERVLARTRSKTLELREDPQGLRVWASLDPEDLDVKSLIPKMKRGDVDQMSFAFTVAREGGDHWDIEDMDTENERVVRTIKKVAGLYDVSVVAQGAYPQTDASLRSLLEAAIADGRIPLLERAANENVAEETQGDSSNADAEKVSEFERSRRLAVMRMRAAMIEL